MAEPDARARAVVRAVGWVVHPRWREEILGDLLEAHTRRADGSWSRARTGVLAARVLVVGVVSRWHALRGTHTWPRASTRGGTSVFDMVLRDIRFALRSFRRAPLFSGAAILTLGSAMGLTVTVFAVVHSVLLRPLAYPDAERLVFVQGQPGARYGVSMPHHVAFAERSPLVESAAAWQGWLPVSRNESGHPQRHPGASVSAEYFRMLGTQAALGQLFRPDHGDPGHEPVVVLGEDLWSASFGSDPDVIGRVWTLDGIPHRIVGVVPADFQDPMARLLGGSRREVWRASPPPFLDAREDRGWVGFWSMARLRPGVRPGELTVAMQRTVREEAVGDDSDRYAREFRAIRFRDALVEGVRPTLRALLGAVALVLLIACANLANLLLARGTARAPELAVRRSLGAGRRRLLTQLLVESMVLAAAAAVVGTALAWGGVRLLVLLGGPLLPRAAEIGVHPGSVAFAAALALGSALVFGLLPALRATGSHRLRLDPTRGGGGHGQGRLRRALVILETALAMSLLSGAGLLLATAYRLETVHPGFDAEQVWTLPVGLHEERFPTPDEQAAALRRIEEAIIGLPDVAAVGSITDLPLSGAVNSTRVLRPEDSPSDAAGRPNVLVRAVTAGYFETLGIPVVQGQVDDALQSLAGEVAVVNDVTARQFFPGRDPLGRILRVRGVDRQIVGVVSAVREFDLTDDGQDPVLYTPYAQEREGWMRGTTTLVVRTSLGGPGAAGRLRNAALNASPRALLGEVRPLRRLLDDLKRAPRFRATLILTFAGLALLLCAVGLGGVVTYTVARRTREIGIRMALGAEAGEVRRMILRDTAGLSVIGIGAGVAVALLGSRVLAGFLVGVHHQDPRVLGVAAVVVLGTGLLAGWWPARRAAALDPAETLRAAS